MKYYHWYTKTQFEISKHYILPIDYIAINNYIDTTYCEFEYHKYNNTYICYSQNSTIINNLKKHFNEHSLELHVLIPADKITEKELRELVESMINVLVINDLQNNFI